MHGGKSTGAPVGNRNAYKTGCHTAEMKALKAAMSNLMHNTNRLIK
jgi:hypothetical protein